MYDSRFAPRRLWFSMGILLILGTGPALAQDAALTPTPEASETVTQEAIPPLEVQLANSNVEEELPGAWWDCYFTCPGQTQTGLFACTSFLLADCCAVMARYCDVTFSWCENGSVGIPCP